MGIKSKNLGSLDLIVLCSFFAFILAFPVVPQNSKSKLTLTCPNQEIIQIESTIPMSEDYNWYDSRHGGNTKDYTYYKVNCNNDDKDIFYIDDKNDLSVSGKYKKIISPIRQDNVEKIFEKLEKEKMNKENFYNKIQKQSAK